MNSWSINKVDRNLNFSILTNFTDVVRNGDFIPKISVGKLSRVKTVAGVDGWKVSRGGAFVVHDKSFYPSHLLDNPTYNITLASHSIQIPQGKIFRHVFGLC